jgi:hypothetical protein
MKTYGIILADNGSNWYVSGAPDARWDNDMLHLLDDLTGDDFEAVDTSGLMLDYDSGATGPISTWYVRGVGRFLHGMSNDTPVPGNFNGDGRDEVATFASPTIPGTFPAWDPLPLARPAISRSWATTMAMAKMTLPCFVHL